MEEKRVRVSIANLAVAVRVKGESVSYPFGILYREKIKAFGGVAMLTERGKKDVEDVFHASSFEFDEKLKFWDARFQVDDRDVDAVLDMFEDLRYSIVNYGFERDRTLDFIERLAGKRPDCEAVLTEDEAKLVVPEYTRSVRQKPSEANVDTSARASADISTRRLFRLYELVMPREIFEKFVSSSSVRILTDDELKTTDGGSRAGRTSDGFIIQNNLFYLG